MRQSSPVRLSCGTVRSGAAVVAFDGERLEARDWPSAVVVSSWRPGAFEDLAPPSRARRSPRAQAGQRQRQQQQEHRLGLPCHGRRHTARPLLYTWPRERWTYGQPAGMCLAALASRWPHVSMRTMQPRAGLAGDEAVRVAARPWFE